MEREDTNKFATFLKNLMKTTIDERGRIYIPKTIRQKLSIKSGDQLFLLMENDHFIVYTVEALAKKIKLELSTLVNNL